MENVLVEAEVDPAEVDPVEVATVEVTTVVLEEAAAGRVDLNALVVLIDGRRLWRWL
jgi:hypothetical protein